MISCKVYLNFYHLLHFDIETLLKIMLHEMIHAYLAVLKLAYDEPDHGPAFCKMIEEISEASGFRLTSPSQEHSQSARYVYMCSNFHCARKFRTVERMHSTPPDSDYKFALEHRKVCHGSWILVIDPQQRHDGFKVKRPSNKRPSQTAVLEELIKIGRPSSTQKSESAEAGLDQDAARETSSPEADIHDYDALIKQSSVSNPVAANQVDGQLCPRKADIIKHRF